MLGYFLKVKNLLPYSCYKSFYDIPFDAFYEKLNKRALIIDLDNTLIPYDMPVANNELADTFKKLIDKGYKIYIASNNHTTRVKIFVEDLNKRFGINLKYMANSCKPFPKCFKWVLKDTSFSKKELLCIGDQLITDVLGSTKMGIDTILVKPIKKKTEKWYTKINRHNEKIVLKKMHKKYPSIYKEIMTNHED